MSKGVGYLLPVGDAYTSDYECCIVAIPAKDEYRRAFFGALDYFATWLAWERDSEKRGKDAALAWLEANEITRECWEMGFCDDMLATMLRIEALLGENQACCGGTTIGPVNNVTTIIVPGQGDDPTLWGETAVADWDEWSEYVCYYANKFVDNLVSSAETLDTVAELGHWTVEFFTNILRLLKFFSLVYPVSYAAALEIYESFKSAGDSSDTFDGVSAKFQEGREDIICAFMLGDSVSDAVEAVLDDATLWTLLYQFNDYDTTQALVYEGSVDGSVYLPPNKLDTCVCSSEPQQLLDNPDFDSGVTGWTITNRTWHDTLLGGQGCIQYTASGGDEPSSTMRTPNFTVPIGHTRVRGEASLFDANGYNFTMTFYFRLASDDSDIANRYAAWGSSAHDYVPAYTLYQDLDEGEEYYCLIRVQKNPATISRITSIKIWSDAP